MVAVQHENLPKSHHVPNQELAILAQNHFHGQRSRTLHRHIERPSIPLMPVTLNGEPHK
ncbi:Uncharacterised protein [Vibrio cholerae]|nr:Uncharacterised protein [Vibrio cholerae]